MDNQKFHHALLRPVILQILRASGFHSARPHAVDALTDMAARYLRQLAERTVEHAQLRHNDPRPEIPDVRLAMVDCAVFSPMMTPSEEAWHETLRKPLGEYSEKVRATEKAKRDADDVKDVREFVDWFASDKNKEIARVAGMLPDETGALGMAVDGEHAREDYVTALKKKHSKTGEESRFQGTILGIPAEDRPIQIEGGPVGSLSAWHESVRQRNAQLAAAQNANGYVDSIEIVEMMADG